MKVVTPKLEVQQVDVFLPTHTQTAGFSRKESEIAFYVKTGISMASLYV